MKISVRVRGEWLQVPCKNGEMTVRWLGEEATRRYKKLQTQDGGSESGEREMVQEVRKTRGGVILDPDDSIRDVLDDNDFVTVVVASERSASTIIPDYLKHILEPVPVKYEAPDEHLFLDGNSLSTNDLRQLGKGRYKIKLTHEAEVKVNKARDLVEKILEEKKVVYGITTGFGKFARIVIDSDKLEELQYNLIRSHAAGVGTPLDTQKARMLLALRINVLAKGHSGISLKTLYCLIKAFNASCLSWVPEQGSVGASGDLAPLAHLALGLLGEGKMWSPETGWGNAQDVLSAHGLSPMRLNAKEGIALINGTQLITSLGAEAVERAFYIARQADVVAALTLEVLKGTSRAFDSDVQMIRPHKGQIAVAKRLRALLHSETYPSQIAESHRFCNRVQDAYTLRCCPQVHGIVHDTIDFVQGIITVEMNSGTDNPIVFAERGEIISAGNFHGEYPAKVLDYLAVAVHELASMSERRTERLVNPALSELPAFLVKDGGLNSGFMLAHCTAAALVSENKALCHPASVDSLSTSAGTEDHVSMGCFAARKAVQVVQNVEKVIAIELLAACQAIEFLRPLKTTVPLEEVYNVVRSVVRPWDKDRYMAPDIEEVTNLLLEEKVWGAVQHHIAYYHAPEELETRVFSPTAVMVGEKQRERAKSEAPSKKRRLE
ncbi:histidine ammonia-lyase-like [Zootermopsis nevadensis]|uniref:Histidine ammonia-lyase n=1 Tax=Zootermopsis nevadensis TaxID=136037 RepID=A0A067R206_ZOONE|nr:histidine ammonia-lyase-like [Zootermopsis nevadensis]KDR16028.1 Histidine ammonia-lyase [Zootermopsis nevadensis]